MKDNQYLECKCCGTEALSVRRFEEEGVVDVLTIPPHSTVYFCMACGDSWISQKAEVDDEYQISYSHQINMTPILKRIATVTTPLVINDTTIKNWEYYYDGRIIEEDEWREILDDRRGLIRSCLVN